MDGYAQTCRQCGKQKDDNGFVICGSCIDVNVEYEKQIDKTRLELARTYVFHRRKDTALMSREHGRGRSRSKETYVNDEVQASWERNSRTQYHGYNYKDE